MLLFSYQQPSYIIASMQGRTACLGGGDSGAFLTLPPLMGCRDLLRSCSGAIADGGLGGDDEVAGVTPVFDTCLLVSPSAFEQKRIAELEQSEQNKGMKRNMTSCK